MFLDRFFISLVQMDLFYKSKVETDLTSLHYFTFIETLVVFPTEALCFNSEQFMNNFMKNVIEGEKMTLSYYRRNISSQPFYCIIKIMRSILKTYRKKFLIFF
jgi:hypothetical protein